MIIYVEPCTIRTCLSQDETVSSFVDKLQEKVRQLYPSQANLDKLLRQSRAAATYDAIVMLAVALDEAVKSGDFGTNASRTLNTTLSNLKLKGLAVSINVDLLPLAIVYLIQFPCSIKIIIHYYCPCMQVKRCMLCPQNIIIISKLRHPKSS